MRGMDEGRYPFRYIPMINHVFGRTNPQNTIEVCSHRKHADAISVDINKDILGVIHDDGQTLETFGDGLFDRWRCDPPYSE